MNGSLVVWNCSPDLVQRMRDVLAAEVSLIECRSWDELQAVVAAHPEAGLIVAAPDRLAMRVARSYASPPAVECDDHERTLSSQVDAWEKRIIADSLQRHGNHRKETAADLGISRVTLYNKMKKFGML